MFPKFLLGPALVAVLIVPAPPAAAWGKTGHRITGALAERWLTVEARRAVTEILGPETLAEASTWPDEMRSSPAPFWQEQAGPWHYVTVPPGRRYDDVGAPPEGDAVTALARFRATLRDPEATVEARALALRFAVHLVADLHQPLHAGNGEDRGGNDVRLSWFGDETNLHRVWDSQIIAGEQLSYSEYARWLDARIDVADHDAWAQTDPRVWIAESVAIRPTVYPDGDRLSWDYGFRHLPTIEARLSKAGVRIAAWLNEVLAAPATRD